MTKKIGDKKIGGVKSTKETSSVEGAEAVSGVTGIKPTAAVGGVRGAGGVGRRRATRTMTPEERQQLFNMISEEAEKMFGAEGLPAGHKEVVQQAVKMAVDAAIIDEDGEPAKDGKGTK